MIVYAHQEEFYLTRLPRKCSIRNLIHTIVLDGETNIGGFNFFVIALPHLHIHELQLFIKLPHIVCFCYILLDPTLIFRDTYQVKV